MIANFNRGYLDVSDTGDFQLLVAAIKIAGKIAVFFLHLAIFASDQNST